MGSGHIVLQCSFRLFETSRWECWCAAFPLSVSWSCFPHHSSSAYIFVSFPLALRAKGTRFRFGVPSAFKAHASLQPEPGALVPQSAMTHQCVFGNVSIQVCVCALTVDSGVSAPEDREADGATERGRAASNGGHGAGQGAHNSGETPQLTVVSCLFPLKIKWPRLLLIASGN